MHQSMPKGRAKKYKRRHVAGTGRFGRLKQRSRQGAGRFGGPEQRRRQDLGYLGEQNRGAGGWGIWRQSTRRQSIQYSDSGFRAAVDYNIQSRADSRVHEIWKSRVEAGDRLGGRGSTRQRRSQQVGRQRKTRGRVT